ncbi:MAG: hypothetical protein H6818_17295 [Phycisphaerales bacterium]|nr:hypothetical protein [Phycisphaerales bacterium]
MQFTRQDRRFILFAVAAMPILVGCASTNVWVEAERRIELPVDAAKQMDVHSDNGSIFVWGDDATADEKITMTVRIRAGGRDRVEADTCLNAIEIDTSPVASGHQTVRTIWRKTKRPDWDARVSYEVHMPTRLALHATTENGAINARNVGGECVLETENGRIEVRGGRGRLKGRTANGQIDAETWASDVDLSSENGMIFAALRADGPIDGRIESANGRVQVLFGERTATVVNVGTSNGAIRTRSLNLSDLHSSRNRLSGQLGAGGGRLKVRSANGHVTLRSIGTTQPGRVVSESDR